MSVQYEQFGKYVLLERLATGGMAEVFLARGTGAGGIGKFFAIKRILPQFADNPEFIDMFKEEAKIAINLSHSNIVSIHEFGVEKGQFFLVMDYVEGRNLRQVLNKMKKTSAQFSLDRVVYIIKEVAAGLDHAHRCINGATGKPLNITHRDMSPQNIMLSFEGEVKIVDFGIAKAESQLETTRAGTLKGKFGYMSPEQVDGMAVDLRTDIFSLGIVLWELLANDRLFVANNEMNIIRKVRDCQIPSLRKINPSIHAELERIVHKALARDRNLRYQTSAALHRDLNRFLNRQYPDFSSHDFAASIKSTFTEEIMAHRKSMIEYAKVNLNISLNLNIPSSKGSMKEINQEAVLQEASEVTQVHEDATSLLDSDTSSLIGGSSAVAQHQKSQETDNQESLRIGAEDTKPNAKQILSLDSLVSATMQSNQNSAADDKTEALPESAVIENMSSEVSQKSNKRSLLDENALAAASMVEFSVSKTPMATEKASPSSTVPEHTGPIETEALPQLVTPSRRMPSRAASSRSDLVVPPPPPNHGMQIATFLVFALICVSAYAYMVKNHQASMVDVIRVTDPALHGLHVALGAHIEDIDHPHPPALRPVPEPVAQRDIATPPPHVDDTPMPSTAGLVVTSAPSGADILLNDKPTGVVTPGRILVPMDDNFSIALRKRGYADFKRSDVSREALGHRLEVNLQKLNVGSLDVEIFPPQEATLYVNGKVTDTSSYLARQILVPGNTPIIVRAESANGLTYDEISVTVPTDQRRSVKINPRRHSRKPANSQ